MNTRATESSENAFTKILTTAPQNGTRPDRRESFLQTLRRKSGMSVNSERDNDELDCPTCKGTGYKEFVTDLVALIPYNDERLKPRRVKRKIALSLFICAVVLGACLYIFLPGKVTVIVGRTTLVNATIVSKDSRNATSHITWNVSVSVVNGNRFLPIQVADLNITLKDYTFEKAVVGVSSSSNFTIHSTKTSRMNFTVATPQSGKANYSSTFLTCSCCSQYGNLHRDVWMAVSVTLQYSLQIGNLKYFTSFVSSLDNFKKDNCNYFETIGNKTIVCVDGYNNCESTFS